MKYLSLSQQWVLFGLALFILGLLYLRFYHHPSSSPEIIIKEVVVEVSGEVRNPGVYIFQHGPTLNEVLERAGGLKEPARRGITLNSEILETATLLTVGREPSEMSEMRQDQINIRIGRMGASKMIVFSIPLDLNQVSMEDLYLIPGIGASLAQDIITYREKRKAFRSVEELREVKGIGDKKWKAIRKFFIVNQSAKRDSSSQTP